MIDVTNDDSGSVQPALLQTPCCQHVLFVGMHNKPGMKPLDSKTMSGKMIDAVIKELPFKCTKTNLCDVDYLPKDKKEIWKHNVEWYNRFNPYSETIVVLLGAWVKDNFFSTHGKIVKLPHPASCMGNVNKENYVKTAIDRITKAVS